jgi:hypothetical protein
MDVIDEGHIFASVSEAVRSFKRETGRPEDPD